MIELLFILGFSLHNLEEALWLPEWSKHAARFHKEVSRNEFYFAIIVITALGYLFTFQYFVCIYSSVALISKYIYLGFVLMMVLNVIFPHIVATIILKRYAPGTLTGILLNAPVGIHLLMKNIDSKADILFTVVAGIVIALIFLLLINLCFKIGRNFDAS
jgi:hypothetical protein